MLPVARLRETPPRSWLFVPALRAPEWLPKAVAAGPDAVIVDLEDATALAEKDRAREVVRGLDLSGERPWIFVRVNAEPARLDADVAAAAAARASGIVLPKVGRAGDLGRVGPAATAILAQLETARGVLAALEIAEADERLVGLGFGGEDLSADLGVARTREVGELATARALVALAATAAGIAAVDTPWLDIADAAGAEREARAVRALGFQGAFVINPRLVEAVHRAFTPSADEVERARRIVTAFDEAVARGSGIATSDGRMIDRPVVVAARRVLARAERGR